MYENVEFTSEAAMLRGRFYRPPASRPLPTVVMTHGCSATITMSADEYAEASCGAGFAVLLYDHRTFGSSDGSPRHQINPWMQARGYRDAITFAAGLREVDPTRIALWGDSLSAAVALVVTGVAERVAAVVAQVPATGRELARPDPDGALYAALGETLEHGDIHGGPDETVDQIQAPSLLQPIQANRWFIDYGGRLGTRWENRASRVTRTSAPFHAGLVAPHIGCPVLMLIAPEDEMPGARPDVARAVFDAVAGPKELVEVDGGHFGVVYHPSAWFDAASAAQRDFLRRVLA